ncbi:hypothetical protein ACH5RR_034640 [Cinchona calisaya]|uniref:RING-type E3 ubiquitin transferase n=1 Tax=Cinchona calisaya TaxID=153742 RepID=A0ABD2YEZ2_9GENT
MKLHKDNSLVFMKIIFLILLPDAYAQNETLPSSQPSKSDGFSFEPKIRVNPSMAIILVCLISAFFIMGCVSVSIRQCSEHGLDTLPDHHARGSHRSHRAVARGLDSTIIDTFPMFLYSDVKGLKLGKGELECAVCLNEFEDDETLRLLPKCSHVFHPDCIDAWLASHITCPVCRANLMVEPGDEDPGLEIRESAIDRSDLILGQQMNDPTSRTNNVAMDIHIGSPELTNQPQIIIHNRPRRPRISGKFPRSHSTGHSLVQSGEDCEKFTLRLPEDVKNQLIRSELSRAKSCVSFTRMRSSTKGFRRSNSGVGRRANSLDNMRFDHVDRLAGWTFTRNSSFFSRAGSTKEVINGEEPTANPKNLFRSAKSFKAPFERLFSGAEKAVDGERSLTKLRSDKSSV